MEMCREDMGSDNCHGYCSIWYSFMDKIPQLHGLCRMIRSHTRCLMVVDNIHLTERKVMNSGTCQSCACVDDSDRHTHTGRGQKKQVFE